VARLQDVGGEAEQTSQTGTGDGHGLVGTVDRDGAWGWGASWGAGDTDGTGWGGGRDGRNRGSGVGIDRSRGWDRAGGADNRAGGVDRLADGAGAVGDGQGGGLGDGVGLAVEADLSGSRADGGERSDDLGGVGEIASPGSGRSGGCESQDGGDLELHLDGDWIGINYFEKQWSGGRDGYWRWMDGMMDVNVFVERVYKTKSLDVVGWNDGCECFR